MFRLSTQEVQKAWDRLLEKAEATVTDLESQMADHYVSRCISRLGSNEYTHHAERLRYLEKEHEAALDRLEGYRRTRRASRADHEALMAALMTGE